MSDIVIKKLTGDCGDPVPNCTTYTIRNFMSLDVELMTPVSHFALPEDCAQAAIIVKAEGNTMIVNVGWTLIDESVSVVAGTCAPTILTPSQQIDYWLGDFQPTSLEDKYSITFDGITKNGYIQKVTFSKDANTPTLYNARMEFIVGDVVAGEA